MMFKDEEGKTLIEALMAIIVLVLGVIGTFTTFDGIKQLGMLGEKKQSATRYAQSEIESMRNMGWANLKLNARRRPPRDTRGTVAGGNYAPPSGGRPGSRRRLHPGQLHVDDVREPGPRVLDLRLGERQHLSLRHAVAGREHRVCLRRRAPTTSHHRRGDRQRAERARRSAIVSSSIVIDPTAAPTNATQNANPVTSTGGTSIGASTGTTYYFSDTPTGGTYAAPSANHATRNTIGASGVPDQLRTTVPLTPGSGSATAVSYSTDVPPQSEGGLGLSSSASCAGGSATTAHRWVTPVINSSAAVTATGNAALSMPTSVLSANAGQNKPGKLCIKVYSATLNGSNQVSSSTLLGLLQLPAARLAGRQRAGLVPVPVPGDGHHFEPRRRRATDGRADRRRRHVVRRHGAGLRPPQLRRIDPTGDAVMNTRRAALGAEDGFSMYIVVMTMMVLLTLGAALSVAGHQSSTAVSDDELGVRALQAAEAGAQAAVHRMNLQQPAQDKCITTSVTQPADR